MDRADIIGLSVAIGGHAILLGMLAFGLFASEEEIEKPDAIAVTLEGEGSPLPVTGDIGEIEPEESLEPETEAAGETEKPEEESEAADEAAAAEAATAEAAAAEAEARRASDAAKAANATAAEKERAKKTAAAAAKKRKDADAAAAKRKKADAAKKKKAEAERKRKAEGKRKKDAAAAAKRKAAENARKQKERDKRLAAAVGGGDGSATPGQARSAANASIGAKVRPFVQRNCKLSAGDSSSLRVFVALTLSKSGALQSSSVYNVKGTTPQNQTQVAPAKRCVLQSLKQASPYNLNAADYNVWKNHKVQVKVNLR